MVASSCGPCSRSMRHTSLNPSPPTGTHVAPVLAQAGDSRRTSGQTERAIVAPQARTAAATSSGPVHQPGAAAA
eukprot:997226-Lingulodinium_polyedra.AAC.1